MVQRLGEAGWVTNTLHANYLNFAFNFNRGINMETDIAMIATGYVLARIGIIAAIGYLFYRVMRSELAKIPLQSQSNYARERFESTRLDR